MLKRLTILMLLLVPCGSLSVSCRKSGPSAEQLGVPAYPGARQLDIGTFHKEVQRKDSRDSWQTLVFVTDDPPGKVIDFYKAKLAGKVRVLQTAYKGVPSAVLNADFGARKTNIVITSDEETKKTRISIASALREK